MRNKHKRTAVVISIGVFALVGLGSVIWRRPIAIKYHKWRIKVLLNREPELDPTSGWSFFDEDWGDAFEMHRDKLVGWGYLRRKEFPLATIKSSLRFRRLWEELQARFPDNPYTIGLGYESDSPATIVVWDQPDNFPQWERIISAHDGPATNVVDASQREHQYLLAFIGHWANEEGEVCYIIAEDTEGNVRIKTPPNKAWRTEFRNLRFDGKRILLDEFNYIDPNDDYMSPIDRSGEHPFSGVRCETMVEVDPQDSNQLLARGSAVSKYGTLTDPNVYILKRIE